MWFFQSSMPYAVFKNEASATLLHYRYFINNKYSLHLNTGYYNTHKKTNADTNTGAIQTRDLHGFQLQAGIERRYDLGKKWTVYFGLDALYQRLFTDTTVYFNDGSQIQKTTLKQTLNNIGGAVCTTVEFHITRRISLSTRVDIRMLGVVDHKIYDTRFPSLNYDTVKNRSRFYSCWPFQACINMKL